MEVVPVQNVPVHLVPLVAAMNLIPNGRGVVQVSVTGDPPVLVQKIKLFLGDVETQSIRVKTTTQQPEQGLTVIPQRTMFGIVQERTVVQQKLVNYVMKTPAFMGQRQNVKRG